MYDKNSVVTLKETTARWMNAWNAFESGDMSPQAFAQAVRGGQLALRTVEAKLLNGMAVKVGDDDVRVL